MANYIVYDSSGKILRTGGCPKSMVAIQAGQNELVMEGLANDIFHKIVAGKVVDKTHAEIEAEKPHGPEPVPFEDQQAKLTNKQWQDLINRLTALEEGKL